MLAVIGPSGAGKTSFISAGLIASRASGLGDPAICTPGNAPVRGSLAPGAGREMAGDPRRSSCSWTSTTRTWRSSSGRPLARSVNDHALLVVDQFEELFTQNPTEVQDVFCGSDRAPGARCRRPCAAVDARRFSLPCHAITRRLAPIFTELTLLGPPTGADLRRALVPAGSKCGYRFEDDELVDKMLTEVEGERGALPLLAFAAARLWDRRNKENGLLTREAYDDIGGVGGALARHAEATIDRVGSERVSSVRELFRNLVTAEGTRAVREWDELLSVFTSEGPLAAESRGGVKPSPTTSDEPEPWGGFLPARRSRSPPRELIDARLLTSYEVHEDEHEPTRRVEIIHESLLANWPRLVRWQTQDQEGAQLRDELRQAARTWDEHGRDDDRLWTGTAYREFQLWRERYPGGLTELEEAFATAMTSLAGRRRRRRRMIVTAVMAALIAGLAIVGSFWQRSVAPRPRPTAPRPPSSSLSVKSCWKAIPRRPWRGRPRASSLPTPGKDDCWLSAPSRRPRP